MRWFFFILFSIGFGPGCSYYTEFHMVIAIGSLRCMRRSEILCLGVFKGCGRNIHSEHKHDFGKDGE